MKKLMARIFMSTMALFILCSGLVFAGGCKSKEVQVDENEIREIIQQYAKSIEAADVHLAETFWQTTDASSFIHPRGHERGWDAIKNNFYINLFRDIFSERALKIYDVTISIYGEGAVAEFYWDFWAIFRTDGSPITTHGRETQIYHKTEEGWKLVHVHYSNMPVTGERQGF